MSVIKTCLFFQNYVHNTGYKGSIVQYIPSYIVYIFWKVGSLGWTLNIRYHAICITFFKTRWGTICKYASMMFFMTGRFYDFSYDFSLAYDFKTIS